MHLRALVGLPASLATHSLKLARDAVGGLLPGGGGDRLRTCAQCGAAVSEHDPFIRYHGEYYHAHRCAEAHPPADRRRRLLAAGMITDR